MRKQNTRKSWLTAGTVAIFAAAAMGLFLFAGGSADEAKADRGVTTEMAAAAAGAKVLPTDKRLRFEPR